MASLLSGIDLRPDGPRSVALVDLACGTCPTCSSGSDLWCDEPRTTGPRVLEFPSNAAQTALSALLAAEAVRCAEPEGGDVVLVLADEDGGLAAALVGLVHSGPILEAADARAESVTAKLSELRPSGRADVVVTAGSDRAAVRAVRRGGSVCIPMDRDAATSVTELVQREVRLVGPRSVTRFVERLGRSAVESLLNLN